ncbi:VIT1/CCC1 transporter family protein [Halothiobacillus sp.]|jgi:VIT1/CCC1 family predicted Fe2+/Mn2+ transporter|uniref:VIT1/CCC1 transporter family protein n=1 Tax=Halothiobacillus sp. TaxID=1891311 RepID=UPI002984FEE5|nr:VIT family protein [Halothiobacillus sp.]MDY0146824.1 VIT family protein [Halothiobacillus sp.]
MTAKKTFDLNAEHHRINRNSWLRASVMGANDGIVSVSSLMLGFIASNADNHTIVLAGLAGLVAGAMSMAAGEYVSVQSQKDTEQADLAQEAQELERNYEYELQELAAIYTDRGLSPALAEQVAKELMEKDALGAHARDELGLHEISRARPLQAALSSAAAFSIGAGMPLVSALLLPQAWLFSGVIAITLLALVILGSLAAWTGGASIVRGASRVLIWGALAMAATSLIGHFFGISV